MGLILFGLGLFLGGFLGVLGMALAAVAHAARVDEERDYDFTGDKGTPGT